MSHSQRRSSRNHTGLILSVGLTMQVVCVVISDFLLLALAAKCVLVNMSRTAFKAYHQCRVNHSTYRIKQVVPHQCRVKPHPSFMPRHNCHMLHQTSPLQLSHCTKCTPRRRTRSVSPSAARQNQCCGPDRSSNSLRPKSGAGDQISTDDLWDQWPDFERLFTWEEVLRTDNLSEHCACQPGGGDKRGPESAPRQKDESPGW